MSYKQRMYCITMRHLSGIAKGIQSLHAVSNSYEPLFGHKEEYDDWVTRDMTVVILEANSQEQLDSVFSSLTLINHPVAEFYEPDLRIRTAVCFLLDERVWDVELYGEYVSDEILRLREIKSPFSLASN